MIPCIAASVLSQFSTNGRTPVETTNGQKVPFSAKTDRVLNCRPSALPKSSWDLTIRPKDDILDEIHARREAYAARMGYDLERIFEDLKLKEANNPASGADPLP